MIVRGESILGDADLNRRSVEIRLFAEITNVDISFTGCVDENAAASGVVKWSTWDEIVVWANTAVYYTKTWVRLLNIPKTYLALVSRNKVFLIWSYWKWMNNVFLVWLKIEDKLTLSIIFAFLWFRNNQSFSIFQ